MVSDWKAPRARPSRLCFYRMDSEDEQLTSSHDRMVLWSVTGAAKAAFMADVAPILTVESQKDMIDQIAGIEEKVDFFESARREIDDLLEWILDSPKPFIGFQEERVIRDAPNIPAPDALEERDDVLAFYLLDSAEASVFDGQEKFILRSMMGAFEPDIAPYLTVERKFDLLERIPDLLVDFGADDRTRIEINGLIAWLQSTDAGYVGFQYEAAK